MKYLGSGGPRRRVVCAGAALGGALVFGLAPVASAPPAHADLFDFDWLTDVLGAGLDSAVGADPLEALFNGVDPALWFDPDSWSDALADLPGATGATDVSGLLDSWISQPVHTAIEDFIDTPLGSQVDGLFTSLTGHDLLGESNGTAATLFGGDDTAGAAAATTDAPDSAGATDLGSSTGSCAGVGPGCVPLEINGTTQPVATISVGGGQDIPVVVDTGSNGLVMPWWDLGLQGLTLPNNFGFGAYSGGMDYLYVTMPETVSFGDGLETTSTVPVNVVLFSWPTLSGLLANPNTLFTAWFLPSFLGPSNADGVLGIAPDAVGPNTGASLVSSLPDGYNEGVLFNEPDRYLQFGDQPDSVGNLTSTGTVNGVANADLGVKVGSSEIVSANNSIIDSGGVFGTMPSSVANSLPTGTEISVYNDHGDFLYSYTAGTPTDNGVATPAIVSGSSPMNTGYYPFSKMPIYINTGTDPSTTFYNPHPQP